MAINLVLTGSHGVGKTTLAGALATALRGRGSVEVIPETARLLAEKGYLVNDEMNDRGVIAYINMYLKNTRCTTAEYILSDRSIFDLYLYVSNSKTRAVAETTKSMIKELVFLESARVDTYVYVPVEFAMMADGLRPEDEEYRRSIDRSVKDLTRYFSLKCVAVSGSVEQRVHSVLEAVNALGKA